MSEFSILRQQAGLSIQKAAECTGYTELTVYRWETGKTRPRRAVLDLLRSYRDGKSSKLSKPSFTFIDLFAGIGGLRRGFEPIGGHCVFTSEWNRYSAETYRANFPENDHDVLGDITEIGSNQIPAHDLLLSGFPCQSFSIAGVSKKRFESPEWFRLRCPGNAVF